MKIVFFGTPRPAVIILDKLQKEFGGGQAKSVISAVVTQEPKPVGRKKILKFSSVDDWAHKRNIPIFFDPGDLIKNNIEVSLGVSASFGKIIPNDVINYIPKKIINVHFSLLPKWRGASPIPATLISGESEVGVSLFLIDEKLDHGPILAQFTQEIDASDTSESLIDKLFLRSADVLMELIPAYLSGKVKAKTQDDEAATYTKIMSKDDGFIPPNILSAAQAGEHFKGDWQISFMHNYKLVNPGPNEIDRFVRAMIPWPIAWTNIKLGKEIKRLKILKTLIENDALVLDEVQLEGKNKVSWKQFEEGYDILPALLSGVSSVVKSKGNSRQGG